MENIKMFITVGTKLTNAILLSSNRSHALISSFLVLIALEDLLYLSFISSALLFILNI